jgi:D-aminoacyl-tRNA deacylase
MKLILYSSDDTAGMNIAAKLVAEQGFEETGQQYMAQPVFGSKDTLLLQIDGSVRDLGTLQYQPEYCVVASRHRAESGNRTLTVHPTGNFGKAEMGGSDGRLQMTQSLAMRQALLLLFEKRRKYGLDYEVSREVTHHGPTDLPFPLLYVEVGSTPAEWGDERACSAAAEAISELTSGRLQEKRSAVGFGGPHYAPNFNPLLEGYAIGHILPKYAAQHINPAVVAEMLSKTSPNPDLAILDWKGLSGADKKSITDTLDGMGVAWDKTTNLK